KILPVTRFYTTNRIHSNMEKITEIDITLREEIELGIQGNGVYFITNKEQDNKFGYGKIKPCSPDKIRASDILVFKPYRRILPIGFMPVSRTKYLQNSIKIDKILNNNSDYFVVELSIEKVTDLLKYVYNTFESDEDGSRFVNYDEFLTSLLYMLKDNDKLSIVVKKNKNNVKIRRSDRLEDAPDNGQQERQRAIQYANTKPVIILLNENGDDESWNYRQFWWPILIAPKLIDNTIYAAKIPEGKINVND
ncbi:hypothetical protein, partial [Anaerorhabdus sp.]|uniref:hypothetical protein n=1 Tax=Anaerorhabdus sp. TaxID=1872524 RepID=UPI002FC6928F